MEKLRSSSNFIESSKPYFAMISLQFGYAGMNIITKVSLNRGMSHYVLVVYRHAFATAIIAPFAFFFERKAQPKITFPVFMQIFILALLGMEKVNMKKVRCQAKVVGTAVTVAGAMLMTLYKGPVVEMIWTKHIHPRKSYVTDTTGTGEKHWFLGSIFLIIATLAWASLFVLQNKALNTYKNHQLSLTSMVCFVGTLQATAVTFVMEHDPSVWKVGWDMNLLAAAYAGIVTSSISYYVQGLVMKKRGPVFATAFSPLMMIIVAIMGSFILAEKIFLGGVLGAVLIVIGLYSVLWGKHKENMQKTEEEIPEAIKGPQINGHGNGSISIMEDIEANEGELKKLANDKLSSLAITMPSQEPQMILVTNPQQKA
ncbi:hypothetical protein FEM48_Zijuj03G0003000 [Ziziphus jujuba var. spinosa]|uniref:WAT1-related protein n=1 Tax=Ziziphus jujuba var. spinosa TaxID=714518 RepID=A0A978VM35_ZIZJJ|nr:hypothetical protein FEM48_Zijuj03G0003000 [Ziziphus jujuba var. spinosa]